MPDNPFTLRDMFFRAQMRSKFPEIFRTDVPDSGPTASEIELSCNRYEFTSRDVQFLKRLRISADAAE